MEENKIKEKSSQSSLVKGSAWMTFGSITSRILGAIYIIPWFALMRPYGNIANALTARSYNIYSIFILISTAGIPGAIAKQVAKYNALNEYGIGRKLFRKGLLVMILLGIISAVAMYYAAPFLASNGSRVNEDQVVVMRSLAYALLIIPILSILRGYFQGYSDMMPSALSQFVEQFARIVWILLTAYVIMRLQHGHYVQAVVQSNFAAAIGAIFGIGILLWFLARRRSKLAHLVKNSRNRITVSTGSLFKEVIAQAIPFVIIDAGIQLFYLVDQYTFDPMIASVVRASSKTIESWYALFSFNANKLIMIIVSLATAMAVTAIPLLSAAHAKHEQKNISLQISNVLDLFFFVMIPAAFGMAAIATPIYTIFYGYDLLGSSILYLSAFTAIGLGLFTVLMAILQGLSENGLAIKYLILGIIVKIICQYPAIYLFKVYGALISTNVGMYVIIFMTLKHLRLNYGFRSERMMRRLVGILSFSIIMFIVALGVERILNPVLKPTHRLAAMLMVLIVVILGVIIYGFLTLKTGLMQKILGKKVVQTLKKFGIRA